MLRAILRAIHCWCAFAPLQLTVVGRASAIRHLWWLLILPGLAVAQAQCNLYKRGGDAYGTPDGPLEPTLAAAEADARSLLFADAPRKSSPPSIEYGFQFGCTTGGSIHCFLTFGTMAQDGTVQSPPVDVLETSIIQLTGACLPTKYSLAATPPPQGEVPACDCVGDPINPAIGNVYKREEDDVRVGGASPIRFQRFYNSADQTGADMGPGWRHTYTRSISVNYQATLKSIFAGQSATTSAQYNDPATACGSGFADIQGSVTAWTGASVTYANNTCVISKGGSTIATLQVNSVYLDPAQATVVEYDVVRDDGKTFRFTTQGGSFTAPPGVSLSLAATGSGFTLTDDQDNVETYNSSGVLQSIASRSGIVQTLSYDANGLLSAVTDSFGNVLTLHRNIPGQLVGVSVNGSATVQFRYDSSSVLPTSQRLATITNTDSTTRIYGYTNATFPNALTSEIDESGTTYATWNYDTQERAASSSLAGGANAVSLVYNDLNSTTVTDALGAVRTFQFGRSGDQMPVTDISGAPCLTCGDAAATTYDAAGFVASQADYNGNLTCYSNDPVRGLELVRVEGFAPGSACPTNLATYTPAAGTTERKISTTWSSAYHLPTQITEATKTASFSYDMSGNLLTKTVTDTTVTPNVSRTWTYTYNSFGQVLTAQGPRTDLNSTRTYSYYSRTSGTQCGQVQNATDELGHVTTFNTYNAYGQPLTITDSNGIVTTLTYDARQRLTSRSTAGETTSVSYYPTGTVKKVTLPDGSYVQYTYDGAHRLTGITDSLGNQIFYTLDGLGNRTATKTYDPSNALAFTQTQVFNTLSELYQQIGSAGTAAVTTTFGYDSNGNQISISAPLARNSTDQYDALNRLIQVTDPGNGATHLNYDTNDRLTSVIDPRSLTTAYTYNGFGDLVQQSSPDTGVTANTFDSAGNLATSTDARSKTGMYTYNAKNRVTQIVYGDQTLSFGYDSGTNGVGHLTSAGDANHSLAWSYDARGRVVGKTQTVGTVTKSLTYSYTNGDLTSLTTPSGQTVTYGYTNGQITSIAINGSPLLSQVLYQPFGPVASWTWANNTNEARVYDRDGNLTNLESAEGFSYSYDNAFRITGITDTDNSALSQSYGHDLVDRLTSATGTGLNESWTYDANGNRLSQGGATSTTYSISPTSNQVTGISGALSRTYGYAASGQTTSYAGLTFTYMNSGRLSSINNGAVTTSFLVNALGQRVKKTGTAVTLFMYNEAGHLIGEYDGAGNLIEETVWMDDIPVAVLKPNGTGISVYYVHTDHLNAPRRISRPSDNVIVWRWDSEPFGAAAANQDPDGDGILFAYNPRLPGQYFDSETGLNYNYTRDYDPGTGRYIESDPIGLGSGINTYAYVGGSPLSLADPLGLWASVSVSGNNVTITIPITYSGPGATPQLIQDWNNAIQRTWSGQFGKYHVTTNVCKGPKNQINVPSGHGAAVTPPPWNTGTWPALGRDGLNNPEWVAAHEAGHLAGLIDEYDRWSGVPYPGWENDIMGANNQPPSERDIANIINWSKF